MKSVNLRDKQRDEIARAKDEIKISCLNLLSRRLKRLKAGKKAQLKPEEERRDSKTIENERACAIRCSWMTWFVCLPDNDVWLSSLVTSYRRQS